MTVEIGTEAAQFLFWEYINGIVVAVHDDMMNPQMIVIGTIGTGALLYLQMFFQFKRQSYEMDMF
jgi:hypothetical protein